MIQQAAAGAIKDLEGSENELAVAVREEIVGSPCQFVGTPNAPANVHAAIDRLVEAANWDITRSLVSAVVSDVATWIKVRLGASAGILGLSSMNAAWSFGTTLAVGAVVNEVWKAIDDPKDNMEQQVCAALDTMSADVSPAVRRALELTVASQKQEWSNRIAEVTQ